MELRQFTNGMDEMIMYVQSEALFLFHIPFPPRILTFKSFNCEIVYDDVEHFQRYIFLQDEFAL